MKTYARPLHPWAVNTRRTTLGCWIADNNMTRAWFADHYRISYKTLACLAEPNAYARELREIPLETVERIAEITGIAVGTLVEDYSRERPRPKVAAAE
jgi:hypothetical protein